MKIRRLVISGFGPYAQRQELDFESNLRNKTMFVITGNTGAGKTTIFDAVNFALYGEASGSERDGRSMRSDFADTGTATEVELWFSLRGNNYYVKRSPAYSRAKQRGGGVVEQSASAEIQFPDGRVITKTTQVTEEIEKILGITADQFKQLVMIPQGEFKRLLNARSDEKEDIFRKIFGTEIFDRIQKQIKEQASGLQNECDQVKRSRLQSIRGFKIREQDDELKVLIAAEDMNIDAVLTRFNGAVKADIDDAAEMEKKIQSQSAVLENIQKEIALGDGINKKLAALDIYKKELASLRAQSGQIKTKELQSASARKALAVKVQEDLFRAKSAEVSLLSASLSSLAANITGFKARLVKAEQAFVFEKGREKEKTDLLQLLDDNEKLKSRAGEYEQSRAAASALEAQVKALKERIAAIETALSRNDAKALSLDKELITVRAAKDEKALLEIEQTKLSHLNELLTKLRSDAALWIAEKKQHDKDAEEYEAVEKRFLSAKSAFERMEDILRRSQAGILARGLADGMPCPVCGSAQHPQKAELTHNDITEESVKIRRDAFESVRDEKDAAIHALTDRAASIKSICNNSIAPVVKELLGFETDSAETIILKTEELLSSGSASLLELEKRIKTLKELSLKEGSIAGLREALNKENEALRTELQTKNSQLAIDGGTLSSAKTTLESITKEFNGKIRTASELSAENAALNGRLAAIKKEYESVEKEFNAAKTLLDTEEGNAVSTGMRKESADRELAECEMLFKNAILSAGFADENDYAKSRMSEEAILSLEEEIRIFAVKIAGAEKIYETSAAEAEKLSPADLTMLNDALEKERAVKKNLDNEYTEIRMRLRHNTETVSACEAFTKEIERDEKEYEVTGRLSKIINGENPKRISFERYVLAAYFEDIIAAANIRFGRMTNRRFEMLRKLDAGDRRRGQGLDLEVFDNYTGKPRDVKTLSGGESFKASLAMALGLADVVQSCTGGIQLDTMFIDEGFGTLDPESLDNAIECLMDLQNDGRLVGIISHVPELKERIDAHLEVNSTNCGSTAAFRV
jgi:exonuclease SbcC